MGDRLANKDRGLARDFARAIRNPVFPVSAAVAAASFAGGIEIVSPAPAFAACPTIELPYQDITGKEHKLPFGSSLACNEGENDRDQHLNNDSSLLRLVQNVAESKVSWAILGAIAGAGISIAVRGSRRFRA